MNSAWRNTLGLALIVGLFGYSAARYAVISIGLAREQTDAEDGHRVIRVLHWQLEPGYRDGLDLALAAYNRLPHVRENRVKAVQLAVTERVYAQFINVHLISGTAPDIVARGMSTFMGTGAATARFFLPISEHVQEPNPYNAPPYLPGGDPDFFALFPVDNLPEGMTREDLFPSTIDTDLAEFLSTTPWNETFTDGMLGGWDEGLQDFYAVPISSWGALRTFCNEDLVAVIKAYLARHWDADPAPPWLRRLLDEDGMVTPDEDFVAWVRSPEVPRTLGRFIVFNEAALAYANETGITLAPIAASSYSFNTMAERYLVPLTYRLADRIDLNRDSAVSGMELLGTWQADWWSFDDPILRDGYFDVVRWLARYYPTGFLGLDREQAMRRFLNRQAIFLSTGGWDAPTIFQGSRKAGFTVGVMPAPLPADGERWAEFSAGPATEAEARLGVPLAVYNRSRHPEWALDLLRFLSSYTVNQAMNVRAGWVPSVVGALPNEDMRDFLPNIEGVKSSMRMGFLWLPTVGHVYQGQFPLFQSGVIDYDTFVHNLSEGFRHERRGVDRMWFEAFVGSRDRARSNERSLAMTYLEALQQGGRDERLWRKHLNLLEFSLRELDGYAPPATFHRLFEDRPFPDF